MGKSARVNGSMAGREKASPDAPVFYARIRA